MTVPKYNEFMQPVLSALSDGHVRTSQELREAMVGCFDLSDEDLAVHIGSGTSQFANNVSWACTYLKQAGLIEQAGKRGAYRITSAGRELLATGIQNLGKNDLMRYPSFVAFTRRTNKAPNPLPASELSGGDGALHTEGTSPEEAIDESLRQIRARLADELLAAIMQQTPDFFESMVVRLLCAMGYGDMQPDAGTVTKKSGDEGIDGIVREDKLGFDKIYVQAKRWDKGSSVGRPELQKFVGALTGVGADKGLFITTAQFSEHAKAYAQQQHATKLVLVDGQTLAGLMIDNNVGVSVRATYELKALDRDFFEE